MPSIKSRRSSQWDDRDHGTAAHQVYLAPLRPDEKEIVSTVRQFVKLPQDRVPHRPRPKFLNRFYEAVVMLDATREFCTRQPLLPGPQGTRDNPRDCPEIAAQSYINGVCQISDTEAYHGETITSCVVLQHADHIEYRLASNRRHNDEDWKAVKVFLDRTLRALGNADRETLRSESFFWTTMRDVLEFCRPRIENKYLAMLVENIPRCRERLTHDRSAEAREVAAKIEEMENTLSLYPCWDTPTYLNSCKKLIVILRDVANSRLHEVIYVYASPGKLDCRDSWCMMRHAMGRLLSYYRTVKHMLSMPMEWPGLFQDFEITHVRSSTPAKSPLKKKYGLEGISHDIIGRMTSDPAEQDAARADAQRLQAHGLGDTLDSKIERKAKNLKPIVHCECLILQSLQDEPDGMHPSRFFNQYCYIGCSKPACKLCTLYFQAAATGIKIRPSHGNLYPNWRVPDVYSAAAATHKEKAMDQMLKLIRGEAFRVLSEKVYTGKRFDSNTDATHPCLDTAMTRLPVVDEEDLEDALEDLHIASPSSSSLSATSAETSFISYPSALDDLDEDDESDGGARL